MAPNYIRGETKRCNGPLHNGEYLSLDEFWVHKGSWRHGKPFSQCKHCLNYRKFGDTGHGLVPFIRVKFIFEELENRLGRTESLRRIGVSHNFYYHHRDGRHKMVRVGIVIAAMKELKKCREEGEVRDRRSINYGATARGRDERVVTELSRFTSYYNGHSDIRNEYSVKSQRKRRDEKRVQLTS
jgi:hypothetical protein